MLLISLYPETSVSTHRRYCQKSSSTRNLTVKTTNIAKSAIDSKMIFHQRRTDDQHTCEKMLSLLIM